MIEMEIKEIIDNLRSIYGMVLYLDNKMNAFPSLNGKAVSEIFEETIIQLEQNNFLVNRNESELVLKALSFAKHALNASEHDRKQMDQYNRLESKIEKFLKIEGKK